MKFSAKHLIVLAFCSVGVTTGCKPKQEKEIQKPASEMNSDMIGYSSDGYDKGVYLGECWSGWKEDCTCDTSENAPYGDIPQIAIKDLKGKLFVITPETEDEANGVMKEIPIPENSKFGDTILYKMKVEKSFNVYGGDTLVQNYLLEMKLAN